MLQRRAVVAILAVAACWLALLPAAAQDPSQLVGQIPGTDMMRDEFRARALVQLKAVALNALTFRVLYGDTYPANLYELRGSTAWNLDVMNMFTGQPVQAIHFEPGDDDYTSRPVLDLPMVVEQKPPAIGDLIGADPGEGEGEGDDEGEGGGEDGGLFLEGAVPTADLLTPTAKQRVDPGKIRYFTAGDIYYYANGDLLQLVIFAPDGGYLELVDESPNLRWQGILQAPPGAPWPDSITVAQVLFFSDRLLEQHYNLVEFMGGRETTPTAQFAAAGSAERIAMAQHLGISICNPATQQPIAVAAEASTGDFAALDPVAPMPLRIWMRDGSAWCMDELHGLDASQSVESPGVEKPREKPERKPPPMGGRK